MRLLHVGKLVVAQCGGIVHLNVVVCVCVSRVYSACVACSCRLTAGIHFLLKVK